MKKLSVFILLSVFVFSFCGCVGKTNNKEKGMEFTDSSGRIVHVPSEIKKVAVSGNVSAMMLSCIAPEYMVNINSKLTELQKQYLPGELDNLPATGQLFGGKGTINYEELISTGAQVLIDMGDLKTSTSEDMNNLQKQLGIPCIFIESDLNHMADAFRMLGTLLSDKEERGNELAAFIEQTINMALENSEKIKESEKVRIMYSAGSDGIGVNSKGSSQAQVIELIGAENAVVTDGVSNKSGGNIVSIEQIYNTDPDVIIFNNENFYQTVFDNNQWKELRAVKNNNCYYVPSYPYNWLSEPPSVNMILGIYWLGNLIYPQYYNYDIKLMEKTIFELFWGYKE